MISYSIQLQKFSSPCMISFFFFNDSKLENVKLFLNLIVFLFNFFIRLYRVHLISNFKTSISPSPSRFMNSKCYFITIQPKKRKKRWYFLEKSFSELNFPWTVRIKYWCFTIKRESSSRVRILYSNNLWRA